MKEGVILIPFRFKKIRKCIDKSSIFNLLDIGSGNHSASKTKKHFPNCNYYAVDIDKYYNNDEKDFELMKEFYEMDLTKLNFTDIPNNFFDVIVLSHIIEHLYNGDLVIEMLLPKLKSNGYIYIEYPSIKSTVFPSKKGCLNFFDDNSHCRIYSLSEIINILLRNHFSRISSGTRRDWVKIFLLFPNLIYQKTKNGYVPGSVFWDILGFAEFIFFHKK
jgi:hypothetical protein